MKQGGEVSTASLNGKTILVVDDDPLFCDFAKAALDKVGALTICANNGHAAVEVLQYTKVDAATIDLIMPEMDGFRLMAHIRHTPSTRKIPLVVISSRNDERAKQDAEQFGIWSYLTKPVVWPNYVAALAAALHEPGKTSNSQQNASAA